MQYNGENDPFGKGRDIIVTGTNLTQPIQHGALFNNSDVTLSASSSVRRVKESNTSENSRGYEVNLTPSGRPITGVLKRTGSGRSNTPRKSVSFVLPDASTSSSQEFDFYYPDVADEVSVPIDAIAAAQKNAPIPVVTTKPFASSTIPRTAPPPAPIDTTQRPQTAKLSLFQAPTMVPETAGEKLPQITREPPKFAMQGPSEPQHPAATFTSLRSKLRGMAPVRVRANRPPSEPLKVCLHCKGSLITHYELKKAADHAIHYFKDARVTGLQFDPLAIWSGDPAAMSRWIIALSDPDACHYLTGTGLNLHGEHYQVDFYDDVLLDEYEVYKMKQSILQAGRRKPTQTA